MKIIDFDFDTFFKYFIKCYVVFFIVLILDCIRIKYQKHKIE